MVQRVSEKISEMDLITQATSAAIVPVTDGGASYKAPITGLLPFADVRMYGTTGTTDDSATLTAALAAVATGGSVIVPAGVTLTVTNVTLNGKRITGPGTLKWKAGASTAMLTLSGTSPTLDGLTIDGESLDHSTNVAVVTSSATQPRFNNLRILNFRYKFFLSDVTNSPGGQVSSCYIYNCGQVTDCDIFGIRSSRWSFSQCDFEHVTAAGHMIRFGQYDIGTNVPVVDSRVIGCSFYDSVEVGVVCELYTQGIEIVGNSFRNLLQGVKIENSGATTSGINIIGNEFRNITLDTAFNWGAPGTYSLNRCYDCGGGFIFTQGAICEGNYIDNCGDGVNAAIAVFSGSTGKYIIRGNNIVNAKHAGIDLVVANCIVEGNHVERAASAALSDGIVVRGGTTRVAGNIVKNAGGLAIRVFGAQNSVEGNIVDGATTALYLETTLTNSLVRNNVMTNVSSTKIVFTDNASFRSCLVQDNPGADELSFSYTIASGVITPGRSSRQCILDTEGGAATDDLDTITSTNAYVGQLLVMQDNNSAHDVTVKHNTGNISLSGGVDFTLLTSAYRLGLIWNGSRWNETFRSTV